MLQKLVNAIDQFIARDLQPISVIDGEGFKHLMEVADPHFVLPSHTYLTNTLLRVCMLKVKRRSSRFCQLSIIALSQPTYGLQSYITLTCYSIDNDWKLHSFVLTTTEVAEDHTSENLVIVLDTIRKEWEIRETVVGASTDNGSNIVKAVRENINRII